MTQPLFFKVTEGEKIRFINAAHVVQIEIDAATMSSGSLQLQDGSRIEFGADEADWIMKLMGVVDEQLKVVFGAFNREADTTP